jgi:hypothetical protein
LPETKEPKAYEAEYKVSSAPTIGALENQLNEQAAKDFHPRKILITSKDQFVAVFVKETYHELPTDEEVDAMIGGTSVSTKEGAPVEKKNAEAHSH